MHTLIMILHIVVSIALVATVLLQAGKGASIGSSLGGSSSQALFGSAGPATFLTKITAACAVIFMLTSLYLTYVSSGVEKSSIMTEVPTVKEAPAKEPKAGKTQAEEPQASSKEKAPAPTQAEPTAKPDSTKPSKGAKSKTPSNATGDSSTK